MDQVHKEPCSRWNCIGYYASSPCLRRVIALHWPRARTFTFYWKWSSHHQSATVPINIGHELVFVPFRVSSAARKCYIVRAPLAKCHWSVSARPCGGHSCLQPKYCPTSPPRSAVTQEQVRQLNQARCMLAACTINQHKKGHGLYARYAKIFRRLPNRQCEQCCEPQRSRKLSNAAASATSTLESGNQIVSGYHQVLHRRIQMRLGYPNKIGMIL